jgi:predicted RNA-binding Zn ribbon-like protein
MRTVRDAIPVSGRAGKVDLIGGELCLDFANTVEPRVEARHGGQPREYLTGYPDLLAWAEHAGILAEREARHLLRAAEARPDEAAATLREALALREAIYRSFYALAKGSQPERPDLDTLTAAYARALGNVRLAAIAGGFGLAWAGAEGALDRPLWPIARSAVELLTQGDPARVKDCPTGEEGCGWLFYDTSKNGRRRWCSMEGCGTLAKELRRRGRQRAR